MPNHDWMAGFSNRDDLTLVDVTFPGSHDAGLQEAEGGFSGYTPVASRADTICQFYDIKGQLEVGSRAFDLRIAKQGNVLRTFHGEGNPLALAGGGWGQGAISIFEQVDDFLRVHTGEIVILRISHSSEKDQIHNQVRASIAASRLYRAGPRNIAAVPLSQLRGKAIVIFDAKALGTTDPLNGLHRFSKFGSVSEGLPICGSYAGQFAGTLTGNQMMREMTQVALDCGNDHGGHARSLSGKHDHIFMVYWQLAWNVKDKSVNTGAARDRGLTKLDDTKGTHYNLDYLFNAHRGALPMYHVTLNPKVGFKTKVSTTVTTGTRLWHRPNWINLDFVNDEACGKVIEFNNELLPG